MTATLIARCLLAAIAVALAAVAVARWRGGGLYAATSDREQEAAEQDERAGL